MLKEALEVGADIIMLDNMSVEDMIEAVTLCAGKALNKRGYISSEIYYCIQKVSQKSCGAFLLYIGRSYSFTSSLHHCDYGFYCL